MILTLREKVEKLLLSPRLVKSERQMLQFVLDTNGDAPLEGVLYPNVEAHIEGRFEWFYDKKGNSRGRKK